MHVVSTPTCKVKKLFLFIAGCMKEHCLVRGEDMKLVWIQHYLRFLGAADSCYVLELNTVKLVSTGKLVKEAFGSMH